MPLTIGPYTIDPPVVLAPMAGITNVAFRRLCRTYGAGLYVCEMITTRALVERDAATLHMITFDPDEQPRSMQLYGVDPETMRAAVEMIVGENLADHIDMNFGCPVPKVTRKGGGAALPYKRRLFGDIVAAAVRAAEKAGIPVTVKFRIGIDEDHHTFLDAGRIAEAEGAAAVALHARTAAQRYSGTADWAAIARLKEAVVDLDSLLDAVDTERPDVVVTDIRMPPGNADEGIQAAERLRDTHPDVGVVVLSQYANPSYALALLDRGSAGRAYLLKERVEDVDQFVGAIRAVADGGSVVDAKVVEALVAESGRSDESPLNELTPREHDVLREMAEGKNNAAIAETLFLTERSVEKVIHSIFLKFGLTWEPAVHRRVKAVILYLAENG